MKKRNSVKDLLNIKHLLEVKWTKQGREKAFLTDLLKSISEKIGFLDIETVYVGRKPRIRLKNSLEKKYNFIVSVSHEKEFAIGIVIAEKI